MYSCLAESMICLKTNVKGPSESNFTLNFGDCLMHQEF